MPQILQVLDGEDYKPRPFCYILHSLPEFKKKKKIGKSSLNYVSLD